ncbi:uncharacterized protein C6orf136 homolog isoform X3 [Petromyzon marinus]|uniref:uncharacterized protein C6orf136 homolog isoform X3 n=1 Tax=Petromyzon marinus TaxID=7757 RepID=UPI003F71782F
MSPYVYERLLASPCLAAGRRLKLRALAKQDRDQTPAFVSVRWFGAGPWGGRQPGPPPRRLAAPIALPSFPHGCPRGLRCLPERPELRPLLCWSLEMSRSPDFITRPVPKEAMALMSPGMSAPLEWLLGPFTSVDGSQRDDIVVRHSPGCAGPPGHPMTRALDGPRRDGALKAVGGFRHGPPGPASKVSPCPPVVTAPEEPRRGPVARTEFAAGGNPAEVAPPPTSPRHRRSALSARDDPRRSPAPAATGAAAPLHLGLTPSGSELDSPRPALLAAAGNGHDPSPYGVVEPGFPDFTDFADRAGSCAGDHGRHRLSFAAATAPRGSSARSGRAGGDRGGDMQEHLINVHSALQHELPHFFMKRHNYKLYSPNVVFIVEFLRLKTRGVVLYQLSLSLLNLLSSLYFVDAHMEVLSLTRHDDSASVQARWRLRGLPFHVFLLRFYRRDRSTLYRYYDAHSTFYVGPDGLIHCHKVAKLMPVNPTEHKLTGLTLGVLGALGLQEERPALSFLTLFLAPLTRGPSCPSVCCSSSSPSPSCASAGRS